MCIDRTCCSASVVKINCTEPDHGTETSFPTEGWQLQGPVRICNKLHRIRARSRFVLVNHELPCEAHAVLPQAPAGCVAIGCATERPSSNHQQISASRQIFVNTRPRLLWK